MFKVMVIVKGSLGNVYLPISQQDKKADADRDAAALKELNAGYKFAVMDED